MCTIFRVFRWCSISEHLWTFKQRGLLIKSGLAFLSHSINLRSNPMFFVTFPIYIHHSKKCYHGLIMYVGIRVYGTHLCRVKQAHNFAFDCTLNCQQNKLSNLVQCIDVHSPIIVRTLMTCFAKRHYRLEIVQCSAHRALSNFAPYTINVLCNLDIVFLYNVHEKPTS